MRCSLISPLPKIIVQRREQKVNSRITEMIKKLGKRRQLQILQQRFQGFWMEDEVKNSLDRIKMRAHKMKTQPLSLNTHQYISQKKRNRNFTMVPKFNMLSKKGQQNRHYLPELKQMVKARERESNSLIIAKRRKIIHLLILGLNRRDLKKYYQSIDIVLLASCYFQRDDQERRLKAACLNLISKLHKQIKMQTLSLKRKIKLNKNRRSLTVVNYHSRENFMENFIQKLRKTKLVGQFSYSESKKDNNNKKRINAKCDVIIPKPQQIFDQSVLNYDYVTITVDDYTNMFPYQYPKSLKQKINVFEYRQMICKLNGLLFPQSKCYSFSSIIKIFYIPFLVIFSVLLAFTLLRSSIVQEAWRIFQIVITIILILIPGVKICWEQSGYTNYIEIKDKMKAYLIEWQEFYSQQNIKFRMGENVDAIFIVFPSQLTDSSLVSSKLTQIQEVDQNFTQNFTQSKGNKQQGNKKQIGQNQSIKGVRRAGSRFDQNGNLMKKNTFSRFANSNTHSKQNFSKLNKNLQQQKKKYIQQSNNLDCCQQLRDIDECQSKKIDEYEQLSNNQKNLFKQTQSNLDKQYKIINKKQKNQDSTTNNNKFSQEQKLVQKQKKDSENRGELEKQPIFGSQSRGKDEKNQIKMKTNTMQGSAETTQNILNSKENGQRGEQKLRCLSRSRQS